MQSLLPAVYPLLKEKLRAELLPDRADHVCVSRHGVAVAAARGTVHRSPAMGLHAPLRHAVHAARACWAWRWPAALPRSCSPRLRWSASALRYSIPKRRAWPGSHRAAATVSHNRSSKSAATPATAIGPLLAAFIVMPRGQASIAWFALGAIAASALLTFVGRWYQRHLVFRRANPQPDRGAVASPLSPARVRWRRSRSCCCSCFRNTSIW